MFSQLQLTGVGAVRTTPASCAEDSQPFLEVRACGICHSDRKAFATPPAGMELPRVLGHEVAGVLLRDLPGCDLHVGDAVALWPALACGHCSFCGNGRRNLCPEIRLFGYHLDGGYSETLSLPSTDLQRLICSGIPRTVSFSEASFAEPIACLLNALGKVPAPPSSLLVLGAGLMGRLAIRLARVLWPQCEILVDDPDRQRLQAATAEARTFDHGPVAAVLVAASSARALSTALAVLAPAGTVILFSGLPGPEKQFVLDHNRIHQREQALVGTYGCTPEQMQQGLAMLGNGAIEVMDLLSKELSLPEAAQELARPTEATDYKSVIVCSRL